MSHQTVGEALRIATVGDTDAASAKFDLPDRQVPIRVSLEEGARNDLDVNNTKKSLNNTMSKKIGGRFIMTRN